MAFFSMKLSAPLYLLLVLELLLCDPDTLQHSFFSDGLRRRRGQTR
jgi:hypothetical protein